MQTTKARRKLFLIQCKWSLCPVPLQVRTKNVCYRGPALHPIRVKTLNLIDLGESDWVSLCLCQSAWMKSPSLT
ncbi:Uncharacterized protein HZ326_30672 [Fusarium oxysporum f. sp. albedinis]|nr:Uncharacterized protein HZ326_30672 [Fusarium oxysporum f. sp. albedinis]